jgi:hypothetical protein
MFNLSKKATALTKQLFGGNQVENKKKHAKQNQKFYGFSRHSI